MNLGEIKREFIRTSSLIDGIRKLGIDFPNLKQFQDESKVLVSEIDAIEKRVKIFLDSIDENILSEKEGVDQGFLLSLVSGLDLNQN